MQKDTVSELEISPMPQGRANGLYLKRPKDGGTLYLRFYPFKTAAGKFKLGRPVTCHWHEGKKYECTGEGCVNCKQGMELSQRMEVACVDRKQSPGTMQITELPLSVFTALTDSIKQNGVGIIGDSGVTFALAYNPTNPPARKYSLSVVMKDKKILSNGGKLLPFEQKPKANPSVGAKVVEVVEAVKAVEDHEAVEDHDDSEDNDDNEDDDLLSIG